MNQGAVQRPYGTLNRDEQLAMNKW